MKVLLIEDNLGFRQQLAEALTAIPSTEVVMQAETQQQACAWLDAHPAAWDLAVIDLFLAKGNGFKVLRQCKRLRPQQKAVVLTNYVQEPVSDYARAAGADAFFDKSLDLDALMDYCTRHAQQLAG